MTAEDVDRFSREVIYCRGCNNHFNLTNEFLEKNGIGKIKWI